jgi:D-xylose transport system substrate-binding protein
MKRINFNQVIIILSGFLLLCSCSQKTKIGFLMDVSDTGRWLKDKELFIKSVEDLGGEVVFRASEGDPEKQYELAGEILNEGVKALVVIPSDLNAAANIVKLAHQREVPVISYDRIIKNCMLDFYISFDNVQVGELQAKYVSTMCPKGKYAVIGGAVTDNNSFLLRLGQLNIIQPLIERGDIEVVYDQYVDYWAPEEGYRLMKECLAKNRNIDVVLAANDQLAEGALKALEEAGIEKLPFISGQDAEVEACRRVIAGKQAMTVYKPIEGIAQKTADIVMQMVEEQRIPRTYMSVNNGKKQVPAILLPAMEVNKETIDLTVVADGYMEQQHLQKD